MFAEDTSFFYSYCNTQTLFQTANKELGCTGQWFTVNKFSLNIKRTKNTFRKTSIIAYQLNYLD